MFGVRHALVVSLICFVSAFARAEFSVPDLTSPVMDQAGIIEPARRAELEAVLRSLRDNGGPQITVLTVPTLEGLPIESASIKVTDAWKLGDKKRDDGVLFFVAVQDRRMRIEVGQGLEGDLPDAYAKRIIDDRVKPFFRSGRMSDGVTVGVRSILERVAPEYLKSLGEEPAKPRTREKHRDDGIPLWLTIFIFIVFFLLSRGGRRSGLLGALAGASLGRSSRGWGGSSGGGGWSGGGGGFSGGGASGDW